MGGCFSTDRKNREEQGSHNNNKNLIPRNGIGRFVQKKQGRVRGSEQGNGEPLKPNLNSLGGCFSTDRKNGEEQGSHNNNKDLIPRNGIGRFVQKKQGSVRGSEQGGSEQGNAEPLKPDSNSLGLSGRFYASGDEVWFDSQLWLDSDSDDDFRSVNGDSLPGLGNMIDQSSSTQNTRYSTFASLKQRIQSSSLETSLSDPQVDMGSSADKKLLAEFLLQTSPTDGRYSLENGSHQRVGGEYQESSSHLSCLPRLLPSISFTDKKEPISPSLHKAKNTLLRLSFKRRSSDVDSAKPSISHVRVERPVAGSQIPFCSADKLIEGTWSMVCPSTFKLRGSSYLRDKIKILASENSIYEPFGVDLFLSPKKISHIAQHVDLPVCSKVGDMPSLLILNIQIPMYPAAIFLNEVDGEGLSLVLYHKLSDKQAKVPSYFQEMFLKVLRDEVETARGFAGDFSVPFRERLKILGRVANPEELHLSVAERKVVYTYNEKPVLSRPQHTFYQGDSYFEVDLDMHRFSYLARKGVESFRERLKLCILDLGLTIQGNKPDELPEHVLCCTRINKIDFTTCKQLIVEEKDAE